MNPCYYHLYYLTAYKPNQRKPLLEASLSARLPNSCISTNQLYKPILGCRLQFSGSTCFPCEDSHIYLYDSTHIGVIDTQEYSTFFPTCNIALYSDIVA